jgi:phosphatidate cytidylyltransferase
LSELAKRILVAVPAAAFFIWMNWLGTWYFTITVILIAFIVIQECIRILEAAEVHPNMLFPYSIGLWVLLTPYLPYPLELGVTILLIYVAMQVFRTSRQSIIELGSTLFTGIYAPAGFLCLLLIRDFRTPEEGFMLTMILLFMVWGNDVFAYFGGRAFGKHIMAAELSPKKTWEGFAFGFLGSGVGLAAVYYLIPLKFELNILFLLPVILLVGIFGPVGDFTVSKLKRVAGVKDSSQLLPGHGGLFDRFDALLLAAPAMFVYMKLLEALGYVRF